MKLKLRKTRRIELGIGMAMLYLVGRAFIFNDVITTGLIVGMIIGMGIGAYYIEEKIIETRKSLEKEPTTHE